MDRKKVMRIATVIAIIMLGIFAFSVFSSSTRGYQDVDTSVALKQLKDGNVKKAQINDREQQLQLDLKKKIDEGDHKDCLLYTSPSPRDKRQSRMPSSA